MVCPVHYNVNGAKVFELHNYHDVSLTFISLISLLSPLYFTDSYLCNILLISLLFYWYLYYLDDILLISLLSPRYLTDIFVISTISSWYHFYLYNISRVSLFEILTVSKFVEWQVLGPNAISFFCIWTNALENIYCSSRHI